MDICIKGARAICEAVGENPKQINYLVDKLNLPAWRRGGNGSWRALPEDLKRWILAQRNSHLPPAQYGVETETKVEPLAEAQAKIEPATIPALTDCKGN